jgi:hypothetical protein
MAIRLVADLLLAAERLGNRSMDAMQFLIECALPWAVVLINSTPADVMPTDDGGVN